MSRSGEAPIFARLTISGQRAEFNINRSVDPDNWNTAKGLSKGKSKRDLELNKYLDSIRVRISEIHTMLVKEEEVINPNVIKQHFLGNAEGPKMLVEVFNYVNDQHKERFDRGDICDGTYLRWKRCAEYLSEFLQKREGREDVPIKKLTSGMIDDFEHFLRVNKGNSNNTAIRYVRFLKKVTRVALANKWLEEDPFIDKHYSRTTTNRGFLTEDEVKCIMALDFTELPRLDQVRDTFIFCCFTGLAFTDVKNLKKEHLVQADNGEWWIRKAREKTDNMCDIPLLDIPRLILEKYQSNPICNEKGLLLPVPSNQRMNSYLKEIADVCGIQKNLSTHIARHTFASLAIANKVSLESIAKMLGHTDIRTTRIYAKIMNSTIANEMKVLQNKFAI